MHKMIHKKLLAIISLLILAKESREQIANVGDTSVGEDSPPTFERPDNFADFFDEYNKKIMVESVADYELTLPSTCACFTHCLARDSCNMFSADIARKSPDVLCFFSSALDLDVLIFNGNTDSFTKKQ